MRGDRGLQPCTNSHISFLRTQEESDGCHIPLASFPGSCPAFVAYCTKTVFCTVCDKKLGRSLGTRLIFHLLNTRGICH